MSRYGRAWQAHRDQMKLTADGYRELADAIEKGNAEEVARLDGVIEERRPQLAYLKKIMDATED